MVSKRSLEVRDLKETVTTEEVVATLCIVLGKTERKCRLYKRVGGAQTAMVCLTEADVRILLGLSKLRVGWVNCRIREHVEVARSFRFQGYGHVGRRGVLVGEMVARTSRFLPLTTGTSSR